MQEEGWPLGLRLLNARIGFSTGSFFRDKSNTLGSLIGISSFLELSRRSTRGTMVEPPKDSKKNHKLRPWFFSLCSEVTTDAMTVNDGPSLGQYLVAERRAHRRSDQNSTIYGSNDFYPVQESGSLFVAGPVSHSSSPSLSVD
ncbi:hypothetical protein Fmac_028318 [Flemingia macrophylla]|uniref:Uncharacterized protein n=1 Tax=Flemingia macrophylla TaxID=520843 RepID=A0ABD1L752_9FABA